ncbi:phosphoglucomutase/phosphomannomutase family protein [Dehalococcoides mccartyi]|uniref:phosphoglucomutase/phosphomannomutase family protein n=1 Tax=Dehalococcoides mccartyi TaxID=61435 RepID=UPI00071D87B8
MKFGTDGWRGIIAKDFTFDNVSVCAQATAAYLKNTSPRNLSLVIGYDTRFASADFARSAAEVMAANGIKVYFCSCPTPTPVISHGVVNLKAAGAVIITASHNPARWNGFKVKSADGASAPTQMITGIEAEIAKLGDKPSVLNLDFDTAVSRGLIEHVDLAPAYFEKIGGLVDIEKLRDAGFNIAIDSMYGAGIGYFKQLLDGGCNRLNEINAEPNPNFPGMLQPEPITPNLAKLMRLVKDIRSDIGLATDGDSDRLGVVDEMGNFLNQLQVFSLLALYMLEVKGLRGPLVKTITNSSMIDKLGELYNVPVFETKVGFKYVSPVMLEQNALIGGEESGGYAFTGHVPERDAILAGAYFLDFMITTGKSPAEMLEYLYSKVGPHYYNRVDYTFAEARREEIIKHLTDQKPASLGETKVVSTDKLDGFRYKLEDGSWLLIRFSGTEPLLRVYAESPSQAKTAALLEDGRQLSGI